MNVTAKPISWKQDDDGDWYESDYGFHIHSDDATPGKYTAYWGEGDEESFDTVNEAKVWCQEQMDTWISDHAVVEIDD